MPTQAQAKLSPEEYLSFERNADCRHTYYRGEIFAMGGASPAHNLIVTNTVRELSTQLKKTPCRVYANDMRVKVDSAGLYTYPDLVIVCGEQQFDDAQKDTLLNPKVLIEVLSDSTEAYDRGEKFELYRSLASLTEYMLISQNKPHIDHYVRQADNHWLLSAAGGLDARIKLGAISCELALSEVFDKVDF